MTRIYQPRYGPNGKLNPKYRARGGKKLNAFQKGLFVAWDGEGGNINGVHSYFLLRNSLGSSVSDTDKGIETIRCLRFLVDCAHLCDTRTIHCCFGASYDVNMILKDLAREQVGQLWRQGKTWFYNYEIEYRHRKCLIVRELGAWFTTKTGKKRRKVLGKITLWDVWGFFQGSFVKALRDYLPNFDRDILATIESHKKQRKEFTVDQFEEIDAYCTMEINALVQMMEKLHAALKTAELPVKRWDGAGAIAATLLDREGVKEHMREFEDEIRTEAWRAYAGGRIELLQYGHFQKEKIFHADICSAYPSAALFLPSFASGHWRYTRVFEPGTFSLWRVDFDYTTSSPEAPAYPFFYRTPQGSIFFPPIGMGTYWEPEVSAALRFDKTGTHIIDGWVWDTSVSEKPFSFIPTLYAQRLQFKKEKNAAQYAVKLGLNSLYGKLAQRVGYNHGQKPPYQQVEWAGYITSYTRAKLFTAHLLHPGGTIMFSTDGIFSTGSLALTEGKMLGDWEIAWHDELISVQSGIYFWRDGEKWSKKYRGFDGDDFTKEIVLEAWQQGKIQTWAPSTRFVTMGQALAGGESFAHWRTWREAYDKDSKHSGRALRLIMHGTKRRDLDDYWRSGGLGPHEEVKRTLPVDLRVYEWFTPSLPSAVYAPTEEEMIDRRLEKEQYDGEL